MVFSGDDKVLSLGVAVVSCSDLSRNAWDPNLNPKKDA